MNGLQNALRTAYQSFSLLLDRVISSENLYCLIKHCSKKPFLVYCRKTGQTKYSFFAEIKYSFELDAETSPRIYKRVFLLDGGKKLYESTAKFNLTGKNDTTCVNFYQIHVEVCAHV